MGVMVKMCPLIKEIVCLYVFFSPVFDPCIYCSAWFRLKLITKITFHTCCSDPPASLPPQIISLLSNIKGRITSCKIDAIVKCSLPMIEKRVYRTLIRFEMEVNPITHRGSGKNVPPYQRNCLFVFSPNLTPFPNTSELSSNHFYQNITFRIIIFPGFFGVCCVC